MSDWGYVTIAYAVVWGSLAIYAGVLARRLVQARELAKSLREGLSEQEAGQDSTICDAPPAQ